MNKSLRSAALCVLLVAVSNVHAQQRLIKSAVKTGNLITAETTDGKWLFSLFPHDIIKATFFALGSSRNEQVSNAVIAKPAVQTAKIKKENSNTVIFWNNNASVTFAGSSIIFKTGKALVTLANTFSATDSRGFNFLLQPSEKIFGTGERSIPLNHRGYRLPLNNMPAYGYSVNAEALNFSVPFILSDKHYALFFDNPSRGFLDIGKSNPELLEYSVTSGELSLYIIPGKNDEAILQTYQSLVGTQPLPPRWAMGNLMSRFGYRDEKQAKDIVEQMKKDSIPLDAIIFDLFWFGDSIKNTLGNLAWVNNIAWPDPKKMIAGFNNEHIKTILITEPFVLKTSQNYEASKNFHATDSAGNPYVLQDFYFGKGGIIDIFKNDAQKWFYSKYKTQMDIGVTGWWGDLGEPETHPANVYHDLKDFGFKRRFSSGEIHNIYGHYWSKMLAENFKKDFPDKRLFHLNRSGYAGSPRYSSFPWSGDVSRTWDGLKGQLPLIQGMSISGIPYIHSDAGGYAGGDGDPELYVRWLQFAAFTPIYRPHGTALGNIDTTVKNIPSEAALWPEPTKTLARAAAQSRYRWLAYNYNLAYLQAKYGKPLITPLFFLNEKDSNLYNAGDQYMWGDEMMVVPVTDKGQTIKKYYIPQGTWTKIDAGMKSFTGPGWITDSSITMESIPVLIKEGSFILLLPPGMRNTADYNNNNLYHDGQHDHKVNPLSLYYMTSSRPGKYELYEDDGEDANAIQKKRYEITTFTGSTIKKTITIGINSDNGKYPGRPDKRAIQLIIPNLKEMPVRISIDGKPYNPASMWNASTNTLTVPFEFQHKKKLIIINSSK